MRSRDSRPSSGHMDQMPEISIGFDIYCQDLSVVLSIGMSKDNCSCSVTKKDAGGTVFIIEPVGNDLASHHQCPFIGAILHKFLGDYQSINKSRTGRIHIEGHSLLRTPLVLDHTGCGRTEHVSRRGSDDDQIQLVRGGARHLEG